MIGTNRWRVVPAGIVAIFAIAVSLISPANASTPLDNLYDSVASDLRAGKPLVIQVHVPLCERSIIPCGNHKLGDGNNPDTNLYWSTSGGFKRWFHPRRGWKLVHTRKNPHDHILETRIWKKRISPNSTWRKRGVSSPFHVYVVTNAWRGTSISTAIDRYVYDLYGSQPVPIQLKSGAVVNAGGAAHIVAYVGHNGWMDIPPYDWKHAETIGDSKIKGTIAVACLTAAYLAAPLTNPKRVPLLMTTSLLFAGAHSFEGAVTAFAKGQSLRRIRQQAAANYAQGQGKSIRRVQGAFTNPSDKRWRRYF